MIRSFHVALSWSTGGAGGSGRMVETLAAHLPAAGVSVEGRVLAPTDVASRTGGRLRPLAPASEGLLRQFAHNRGLLTEELAQHPDIVASHFALTVAPVLDKLRVHRFVVHFHGPWAAESRVQGAGSLSVATKLRLEKAVYHRADLLITLSAAFSDVLVRDYGIPRSRIRVIPGAVDLDRFHPPTSKRLPRAALGWPNDRTILLTVRRLVPRMGLDNLIRAIAELRREHPDVLLYMAGKGPMLESLQHLTRELDLTEHVRFLGFVPEEHLVSLYQAADLNVVPTLALEGFGLVAAEALAAGTPSLVSPVGGLPEVVAGLSPDLVCRSASPPDLAAALRAVLSSTIQLPSSAQCRAFASEQFSASLMAERTATVYRELL